MALALKRQAPGDHLVDHHAQRPDVRAAAGRQALGLLGRHVGGRSQHGRGLCEPRLFSQLGQAEVHDLDLAFLGQHEVGGFDVTMDDLFLVRRFEALGGLDGNVQGFVKLERALGDLVLDALALDIGHGDKGLACDLIDLMDGANVLMI